MQLLLIQSSTICLRILAWNEGFVAVHAMYENGKVSKGTKIRNRSSTTPDPGYQWFVRVCVCEGLCWSFLLCITLCSSIQPIVALAQQYTNLCKILGPTRLIIHCHLSRKLATIVLKKSRITLVLGPFPRQSIYEPQHVIFNNVAF